MKTSDHDKPRHGEPCCPEIPELRRLEYFYGQLLDSQDFRDEQSYFREKLKLAHRCLHGYGVVCGLRVVPEPGEEPCEPEKDGKRRKHRDPAYEEDHAREDEEREEDWKDRPPARVVVECGVAIDCEGNEIVVRRPCAVDLWQALAPADRRRLRDPRKRQEAYDEEAYDQEGYPEEPYGEPEPGATLYLSLCFCELPVKPVRPVRSERCDPPGGCRHAQVQDSFRIVVSLDPPPADTRCEPCCCPCGEPCLLLARIDGFVPGRPVAPEQVHDGVRRRFGLYDWTTVTGLGWVHGGWYDDAAAARILGRPGKGRGKGKEKEKDRKYKEKGKEEAGGEEDYAPEEGTTGLEIRFSRPVRTATLGPGVVVVTVYEGFAGGTGRSSDIYNLHGELELPEGDSTDRVVWRQTSDDKLEEGDMVLLQVKADFILDECCRPVDGEHVGGRVPLLAEHAGDHHPEPDVDACHEPPDHPGPWTSGNGRGGGTFESWIFITY